MTKVVRILPLSDLMRAINRGRDHDGCWPSRIVACPVQMAKWSSEAIADYEFAKPGPTSATRLTIMGIPLVEGAEDADPELIWAVKIEGAA